jgi:DUF1680 family protein
MYKRDWQHVGGGIVMCEFLDAYPGCAWLSPPKPYNELCCTSFWILLNQRLHRLFPDKEEYVAEMERSLYNVAIANQEGSEGIRYFAWIDQHKQKGGLVHCCCGVGTRLYGLLPEFLYSVTDEDDALPALYVDLYNSSEFTWERKQGRVIVKTNANMPYDGRIGIDVEGEGEQEFSLKLRIPSWVGGPVTVTVDGNKSVTGQKGTYLAIDENWSGSHRIDLTLPFGWKLTKYHGAEEYYNKSAEPPVRYERWAYEYGPLLMAVGAAPKDGEFESHTALNFLLKLNPHDYASWMEKTSEPLRFNVRGHPYKIIPYFELGSDDPFSCYPYFNQEE